MSIGNINSTIPFCKTKINTFYMSINLILGNMIFAQDNLYNHFNIYKFWNISLKGKTVSVFFIDTFVPSFTHKMMFPRV